MAARVVTGREEWAPAAYNCVLGCPHNCRYCYARHSSMTRYGKITKSIEDWCDPKPRRKNLSRAGRLYSGGVMFPTTHDIVPPVLDLCVEALRKLLGAGNEVLVVTKPHLECVQRICEEFAAYATPDSPDSSKLHWRFTIGAEDDEILRFWEPGAPPFEERLTCLRLAHAAGFSTSVSMEPLLDPPRAVALVEKLLPYVTDAVWLGLMNRAKSRCVFDAPGDEKALGQLLTLYDSDVLDGVHAALRDNPKVKWKFEIRKRLGLL